MKKNAAMYEAPRCEHAEELLKDLLCTSPGAGSNEDVEYEDWVAL